MRWYHNGTDSLDCPAIINGEEYDKLGYSAQCSFSNGPYESFSAAKAALVEELVNIRKAYSDAIKLAKVLKKREL